jgi:hypothetical protein
VAQGAKDPEKKKGKKYRESEHCKEVEAGMTN